MSNENFDKILDEIKNQKNKQDATDYIMKQLKPDQSKRLQTLLSDKNAMEQLLSTPQAQDLLKKFTEDKNG
jgi:peptidyl-tRNA hydrolase